MLAPMDLGFGHVFVAFFNNDSITVSLKLLRLYNCSVELSHRLASCELSSQGTADTIPHESDDIWKVNIWDKNIDNNLKWCCFVGRMRGRLLARRSVILIEEARPTNSQVWIRCLSLLWRG